MTQLRKHEYPRFVAGYMHVGSSVARGRLAFWSNSDSSGSWLADASTLSESALQIRQRYVIITQR